MERAEAVARNEARDCVRDIASDQVDEVMEPIILRQLFKIMGDEDDGFGFSDPENRLNSDEVRAIIAALEGS